ncbi:MAG TPA: molecular chaperone DnaJ [Chloroflexi bacterium]|nr:molecular chaperone DnaJ [Chloroflexota bacterium]
MEFKDYYEILGVARDADEKEIRKAYRRLARQYHPDVNPGNQEAEERFKEINEAYEVLSDPEKRARYDQFGRDWQRYRDTGAPGGFDWSQYTQQPGGPRVQYTYTTAEDLNDLFGEEAGFSDFFETLFGRAGFGQRGAPRTRAARPRQGQDIEQPLQVTLAEAYHGTTRLLTKDGRRLEVTIPPGVRNGSRVRMSGEGAPGVGGGPAGDLYLIVEVLPDERFERRRDDLYTGIEVPLLTAVLGGEVTVPTLTGNVQLTIPPETQNGRLFRLRGKGMPRLHNPTEPGDLYATVTVRLPTRLSDRERELFEQLRTLQGRGER